MCKEKSFLQLVEDIKKNEEGSLLELIQRFMPLIKKYSFKLDYTEAISDLTIDFICLARKLPDFEKEGQVVGYIQTSMYHFYIKHVKERILLRENECIYDPDIIKNMPAFSEAMDIDGISLHIAVNKLPRQQRQVIEYKYFKLMSDREIEQCMGISRQTVFKYKKRALERLKQMLKE